MQHGRRDARVGHEGVSKLTGRRARLGTAADALAEIQAGTDLSHAAPPRWPGEQVPRDVEREYGALHAFVLSVADGAVRAELLELLYPLFVNCFFMVVRHHHNPEVRARFAPSEMVDFVQFFARYAPTFRAVHGDELGAVFSCRTFTAMTFSPVHRRLGRERYRVRISTAALAVALGFLYDHCCTILLTKLFQRVLVCPVPALPHAARDMRLFVADTQHAPAAAAVLRDAGPLALDIPADLAVLSVAAMRGRRAARRAEQGASASATTSSADLGNGNDGNDGNGEGNEDEENSAAHRKGRRGRRKKVRAEDGDDSAAAAGAGGAGTGEGEDDGGGDNDDDGGGGGGAGSGDEENDDEWDDGEGGGSAGGDGTVPLYCGAGGGGSEHRRARAVFPPAVQARLRNSRICARATRLGAGGALPSACVCTVHDVSETVACMAVGATGALVAAGRTTAAISVWAPGAARQVTEAFLPPPRCTLAGHSGAVTSVAASLDEQYLLSAAADGTARLWCVPLARALATYAAWAPREPLWAAQFAPAGDAFVAGSHDRTARLFATNFLHPVRVFAGHDADVTAAAFHPGGAYVATASADGTARLWDIGTGRCVRLLAAQGHALAALALSPDGRHAAAGSLHGDISVWDLAAGRPVRRLAAHAPAPVHSLAFSTDGLVLASGSADCTVRLWDTSPAALAPPPGARRPEPPEPAHAACLATLRTRQTPVHTVQFTLANLLIAAGPFLETHPEDYLAP